MSMMKLTPEVVTQGARAEAQTMQQEKQSTLRKTTSAMAATEAFRSS